MVKEHVESSGVEVFTVDRYQGRDKPCIIVSFVRNNETANVSDFPVKLLQYYFLTGFTGRQFTS